MLLMPTISRIAETDKTDQAQLFALGLDHVRRFSRRVWTDHNLHDPGITTLEQLCYALTDLTYRSRFNVADLLAVPENDSHNMAAQFVTAREILPNRPLTERDYRKLLIDLAGVKNAWLFSAIRRLGVDTIHGELSNDFAEGPGKHAVPIAGLHGVRIEYMDSVTTAADKLAVRTAVETRLQANRNLCEDFVTYDEVEPCYFSLCAELELAPDANQVEIAAQIRFQVERYLAPPVHCYSLHKMLTERRRTDGGAYSVADIFAGPVLDNGFIDDEELDRAALREEIRLSDIISIIMDISGVRAVRDIAVNELTLNPVTQQWDTVQSDEPWRLFVPPGRQPRLSAAVHRLVFYKRNFPVTADSAGVQTRVDALNEAERISLETPRPEDLPIPLGRARGVDVYHSFQHHFPEVYGISDNGLPATASPERRAQALQLKGYLLFFDQVMANYFAQLANVRSLFRRDFAAVHAKATESPNLSDDRTVVRTMFAQRVESFDDFAKVYAPGVDAEALAELLEDAASALERRNKILDHLLARYAEEFHHYASITRTAFGATALAMAQTKSRFLMEYPELGAQRALGWNKSLETEAALWNSINVSGLERRLARLLGIANDARRNLGAVTYETYAEVDATPDDEFRFRIKHPVGGKILLSSSTHYSTREAAKIEIQQTIERAQLEAGYERKTTVDGKHYFNVVDANGQVIARRIEYFPTPETMETAIAALLAHVREFYGHLRDPNGGEGLYLIENVQLLPPSDQAVTVDDWIKICPDPNCANCAELDPYSYRIHIVLPAFAGRFRDMSFRQFVEETVRQETPAHILPKVCWINETDMKTFEDCYRTWILTRPTRNTDEGREANRKLIVALREIKSVYPTRPLRDCSNDETKPPFILGSTALGNEEPRD